MERSKKRRAAYYQPLTVSKVWPGMLDEDDVNVVNKEERGYLKWEREQKNRILSMSNVARKVEAWRSLFPTPDIDLAIYGLTEEQLNEINKTVY